MKDVKPASDVHSLLQLLELTDVLFYEIAGQRRTEADGDADEGGVAIEVKVGFDDRRVEVRLVGTYMAPTAHLRVDTSCLFQSEVPFAAPEAVVREFAERVGVMAAYPYLREALTEVAAKIRIPAPVIGLLRPGVISLTQEG